MTQSQASRKRDLYPNTLAIEIPTGTSGDVRASLALLMYGRAFYDDLKIKKHGGEDNVSEQQGRIAHALYALAQTQPSPRPLNISINTPDEARGERRAGLEAGVRQAFASYPHPITFRATQYDMQPLTLVLKHARERGHWSDLNLDQTLYLNSLSNGDHTVSTVLTVKPRRIYWKSVATDSGDALATSLHHLREILPDIETSARVGLWSNAPTIRDLIAGRSLTTSRDLRSLIIGIRDYRKTRSIELSLTPERDSSLQDLSHFLTLRAYQQFLNGKLLTPKMQTPAKEAT